MQACTERRPNSLKSLMENDRTTNRWVVSGSLEFYVRKGHISTKHDDASYIKPCLMVANFHVKKRKAAEAKRLASQMIDFMKEVEAYAVQFGYAGVFVECVYNARLRPLLTRFGYRRLHQANYVAPCYFKSTSSILSNVRRAPRAIQTLQRPSLRRFLQTQDIERFWLREQNENVIMLLRRDRIDSIAMESYTRLTLLDLYHYKVTAAPSYADHVLYWSEDHILFTNLLQKLESRIVSAGFQELAICPQTISTFVKTEYGGRTNVGSDPKVVDRRMQQLGYSVSSVASSLKVYVKSLAALPQ